jgi:hypothetical protein
VHRVGEESRSQVRLNEHEKVRAAPTFVKISSGTEIYRKLDMERPKDDRCAHALAFIMFIFVPLEGAPRGSR